MYKMSDNQNVEPRVQPEPLLADNPQRYVYFPIKYPKIHHMYKKAVASFWTVEEVKLDKDMKDWLTLTNDEQHFIKNILAFFAASDGIVLENLGMRFMSEVQLPEARAFYGFQIAVENIHSEMYSLLIDTYIKDTEEKSYLFNAVENISSIKKKAEWAIKWINDDMSNFPTRLIAFACVEGIFFSGSFCAIFWLKKRGLMPGLTVSNEFISRDEGLHTDFAVLLYGMVVNKLSEETIHNIVGDAVEIEKEFIIDSIPCAMIGMNSSMMSGYIEFVADRLLTQLGYNKLYKTANPFDFMELISLENKTNFFEERVTAYSKAGIGRSREDMTFSMDAEF